MGREVKDRSGNGAVFLVCPAFDSASLFAVRLFDISQKTPESVSGTLVAGNMIVINTLKKRDQ